MATEHQRAQLEKRLREYRKKYLTKKQNLDVNESATRIMVNYFLTEVLQYQELEDIKTEYAIRGEYADYVIQLKRKKHFVVEVKSIELDLNERHLRQSLSYAANEGIDWILLFNGRQIQLYRVIFAKPLSVHAVFDLDLRELSVMRRASEQLVNLMKSSILKNDLEVYWKRFDALTPDGLAKTVYTHDVINAVRLKLRKTSGINFDNQEVLEAVSELLQHGCEVHAPRNLK